MNGVKLSDKLPIIANLKNLAKQLVIQYATRHSYQHQKPS